MGAKHFLPNYLIMILTAHQPCYLPWTGLFNKISLADSFCIFDCVQYQKKDFNNRVRINYNGKPCWLTVPVHSKNHFSKSVGDIEIFQNGWQKKHAKTITACYGKTPYFKKFSGDIFEILNTYSQHTLAELNKMFLNYFCELLKLKPQIFSAKDLNLRGKKSDLVLDMCIKLGAKKYIFGSNGKAYADPRSFSENNIEVFFQQYECPPYKHVSDNFVPNLSVIDCIFHLGELSASYVRSNLLSWQVPT